MIKFSVSIIIPCRNEGKFIGKCLDSILEQDYLKDKIDVLVVDGMSTDKTCEIVKKYAQKSNTVKFFDNPKFTTPGGMNIGVREASGQVIVIMGAHTIYTKNYISKCIIYLNQYHVDVVGGLIQTLPGAETLKAKAIALVLSSPFGVGNSYFRTGIKEPKFVDTVPFGCYRREVFDKIGFFDEDLIRNQDDEFNLRLIKSGGKILLVPDIVSKYYARDKFLKLWNMYYQYGYFKPLVVKKVGGVLTWRQLIPGIMVSSMLILVIGAFFNRYLFLLFLSEAGIYLIVNFVFSLALAMKNGISLLFFLMISFIVLHFSYGIGYLKGVIDFMVFRKNKIKDMPISR